MDAKNRLINTDTLVRATAKSSMPASIIRPGSTRTQLCVDGKAMLYAFCREFGVAHKRCGKLPVAVAAWPASREPSSGIAISKAKAVMLDTPGMLIRDGEAIGEAFVGFDKLEDCGFDCQAICRSICSRR